MAETETGTRTAAELSKTAELVLVRLLAAGGKSGPGPKRVRDDVAKLGASIASDDAWAALLADLLSAGLLAEGKGLRLSEAGRARALRVLGLAALPANATWPRLRDGHLVGVAAGAPGGAGDALRAKGKLSAYMLKRRFGLRVPEGATVGTAAAALVCKVLGFPELSDFKSLQAAVLGRLLDPPQALPPDAAVEQFVRVQFGARRGKVDELRQALIAEWVRGGEPGRAPQPTTPADRVSTAPAPGSVHAGANGDAGGGFDLAAFAAAARRAAAASPTGWFGDNKVFIAHAWRRYRSDAAVPDLDLPSFKGRLVEANRAGLLALSRADLVAAMDPADVRESEARYLNAEFHFILIEGGAP